MTYSTSYSEVRDITKCEIPRSAIYHEVGIPQTLIYRKVRDTKTHEILGSTRHHKVRDTTKYELPRSARQPKYHIPRTTRYHNIRDCTKCPRWPRDGHKMASRWPRDSPQDGAKTEDGPKKALRWPKIGPRWPQDGLKRAPRGAQEGPKTAPSRILNEGYHHVLPPSCHLIGISPHLLGHVAAKLLQDASFMPSRR